MQEVQQSIDTSTARFHKFRPCLLTGDMRIGMRPEKPAAVQYCNNVYQDQQVVYTVYSILVKLERSLPPPCLVSVPFPQANHWRACRELM